ncbi:hypothetical protein Vafri_9398 [Volvox africanus]|uniref:Helicase HerA central domain-containing protein n=1 Tax=Volvox africanus TaxID=51714 RepID=A0A8J4EZR0_9CHLO|nr:hypothetical protein Vafri_9398 [Volvox africanus]
MALEDRGAACRRVAELYKDDADFCVKVLTNLTSLGDAQFAVLRKEWEKVLDSPAEETFLEEITTLKGWASPHRQASHNKGMKQFWQTLIGLEITAGSFLNLPSNVYLLGRSTWGSSLLVRHCYRGIFDRMMDLRSSNTYRHFLITGTPGIGKSFFAFVLMGWLAKEKKVSKIVFDTQGKRHVLTSKGTDVNVMEGRINMDFDDELEDPRTWWIVDTDIPVERAASTVLLASPDQKRYKEFVNFRGATTLYMPVWTDDEMEKCRYKSCKLHAGADYITCHVLVIHIV